MLDLVKVGPLGCWTSWMLDLVDVGPRELETKHGRHCSLYTVFKNVVKLRLHAHNRNDLVAQILAKLV